MELFLGRSLHIRRILKKSSVACRRIRSEKLSSVAKEVENESDIHSSPKNPKKVKNIPDQIYISGKHAIEETSRILTTHLCNSKNLPLIQVNPGFGQLTHKLIEAGFTSIKLVESNQARFQSELEILKNEYPDKVDYSFGKYFELSKLIYQDSLDKGVRTKNLLNINLDQAQHGDVSMNVVGVLSSLDFIWSLLLSAISQASMFSIGRANFYLWMTPSNYYRIVTDENCIYRSNLYYKLRPVVFNILFDHQVVSEVSQTEFHPQLTNFSFKSIHDSKILNTNSDKMYLVHVSFKKEFPFEIETLPIFWYFCKHHLRNKTNRIIPMFEQWIPGCGIWLITGQDPPGTCSIKKPTKNDTPLPHITIFTRFSDLNPGQIVTLFKRFYSWPDFEESTFKEAYEQSLYKGSSASDGLKAEIAIQEDDSNDPTNQIL